jgi:hypothetical protein
MSFLFFVLKVAVSEFVLNVLYRQSYNLLFFYLRKPTLWIIAVGCLGFLWFLIGSILNFSFNVVWLAAAIALALNIPKSMFSKAEMSDISDDITGVVNSVRKSRAGLVSFALGSVLGWFLFWTEYCTLSGECNKLFW